MECDLCDGPGGEILWRGPMLRIVAAAEPDFPGLCRVVLARHAREMTDLDAAECEAILRAVVAVEAALRAVCSPDKMNLASLGNVTPHVHWHVIPRWRDDACFPDPIWSPRRRTPAARTFGTAERERVRAMLADRLGPSSSTRAGAD